MGVINKKYTKAKLYASFCGTGKTYICNKTDVKSIEIEYWKYKDKGLEKEYIEDIKNTLTMLIISSYQPTQKD